MRTCENCGATIRDGMTVCLKCGQSYLEKNKGEEEIKEQKSGRIFDDKFYNKTGDDQATESLQNEKEIKIEEVSENVAEKQVAVEKEPLPTQEKKKDKEAKKKVKEAKKKRKTPLVFLALVIVIAGSLAFLYFNTDIGMNMRMNSKLETARAHLEASENYKALLLYEEILYQDSENIEALSGLAEIYVSEGNVEMGLQLYEHILAIDSMNTLARTKYDALLGGNMTTSNGGAVAVSLNDLAYERIMLADAFLYFYDTVDLKGSYVDSAVLSVNNETVYETNIMDVDIQAFVFDVFSDGVFENQYFNTLLTLEIELYDGNTMVHKGVIENFIIISNLDYIPLEANHVFLEDADDIDFQMVESKNIKSLHVLGYGDSLVNVYNYGNLTYLNLYGCRVESGISNMTSLNKLALFDSEIDFYALTGMGNLKQFFAFECEGLYGDVNEFSNMQSLKTLQIYGYNDLYGDISAFNGLSDLMILDMPQASLSGDPYGLTNPKLEYVNVGGGSQSNLFIYTDMMYISDNVFVTDGQYPYVFFNGDGTFEMGVSFTDGTSTIFGMYFVEGNRVSCSVTQVNFTGGLGEDLQVFEFEIIDENTLIYMGDYVGLTASGDVFLLSSW